MVGPITSKGSKHKFDYIIVTLVIDEHHSKEHNDHLPVTYIKKVLSSKIRMGKILINKTNQKKKVKP